MSWDEAIDYAAREFKRIQAKYGRDSIGGITSSRCTNEETFLVQKLVRAAFGNNNVDTCARVCHSPTGYGLKQTLGESAGTQDFDSVEQADVIMVIGANPTDGHPVFASQMKRRLREGAKLIVVDPRAIDLVRTPHVEADYHLQLRPGTNVALINALAHVVVTEGWRDEAYVARALRARSRSSSGRSSSPSREQLARSHGGDHRRAGRRRCAAPRGCTPRGGNGAIYYGLGVTEHSQGSTMVMGIANLAMATGNLGREGVGVNPLRGQNNVQGSCDMGSFPHEFRGYRHVSDDADARAVRARLGRARSTPSRACAFRTCSRPRSTAASRACTSRARTSRSPTRTRSTSPRRCRRMECIVVQDLFLNETAKFAHVFLPGSSFLEKDGTFTNAERRISRVRKVMQPLAGLADWEVTVRLSNALGYPDALHAPVARSWTRSRALTPTFTRRELREARPARQHPVALQRRGAGRHADDARRRVRARQGQVLRHRVRADRRDARRGKYPAAPHHRAAS